MRALLLVLLLAACGGPDAATAPPAANHAAAEPVQPPRVPTAAERADMEAATATLRSYYDALGRGDHRAAWRLREQRPGLSFEAFAASFDVYETYRADIGTPSFPGEAGGFVWIDAPVQLWGRRRDGRPFGTVGRVMLRRPAGDARRSAWRIAV